MRLPENIEKAGFPSKHPPRKQYVGYGRGLVWRIYKNGTGIWEGVAFDPNAECSHFERAGTLAALGQKIAADGPAGPCCAVHIA